MSKTDEDEGVAGMSGTEGGPSRPTSPLKSQKKMRVKEEKPILEDDDADEEKMDHRKRKRNRTIRSCVPCHNHKRKVRLSAFELPLMSVR
jgi:hypothetical protein